MRLKLRSLLVLGLLLMVLAVGLLLRRLGWAEAGVLVALAGLAFVIESARFIWQQFARGLRGERPRDR